MPVCDAICSIWWLLASVLCLWVSVKHAQLQRDHLFYGLARTLVTDEAGQAAEQEVSCRAAGM